MRLEEVKVNGIYETIHPVYSGNLLVIEAGKRVTVVRVTYVAALVVVREVDALGNFIGDEWLTKLSNLQKATPLTGLFS